MSTRTKTTELRFNSEYGDADVRTLSFRALTDDDDGDVLLIENSEGPAFWLTAAEVKMLRAFLENLS